MLRNHFIKIAVIFLSLVALTSFLRLFYLIERFSEKIAWHESLKTLLNDQDPFTYKYDDKEYNIDLEVKSLITEYINGLGEGEEVKFSDFTEHVGKNILNVLPVGSLEYASESLDKKNKKSAKKMIRRYAKKVLGAEGITKQSETINNLFLQTDSS
tara:strand:+ start:15 stop:482 length:468 start_codon:yes stop_codon:yes gene_type:complete